MSDSFVIPWTVACQAPPSMGFSRQEYWSGLPLQNFWPPKLWNDKFVLLWATKVMVTCNSSSRKLIQMLFQFFISHSENSSKFQNWLFKSSKHLYLGAWPASQIQLMQNENYDHLPKSSCGLLWQYSFTHLLIIFLIYMFISQMFRVLTMPDNSDTQNTEVNKR